MTTVISGDTGIDKVQDGAIVPADLAQPLTTMTAQASTSGTAIDFTSIPSWVRRITVMLNGIGTNGSSVPIIQIGDAGGIETSGYSGGASDFAAYVGQTTGFAIARSWANTFTSYGSITLSLLDRSTNLWVASGSVADTVGVAVFSTGGAKALSATLDRVRITTTTGTNFFAAGTINVTYE